MLKKEKVVFKKELYVFTVLNFILILILSFSYQNFVESYDDSFSKIYNFFTSFSHFFLLSLFPLLIGLGCYFLTKSKIFTKTIIIILNVVLIVLLKTDTIVYEQFRYHLSPIVFQLVFGKNATDIFQFSWANIRIALFFIIVIVVVQFLFFYIAKKVVTRKKRLFIVPTLTLFLVSLLFSHITFAWADVNFYRPITQFKTVFPVFYPLTAESLMTKMGMVNEEYVSRKNILKPTQNQTLQYPLQNIKTKNRATQKNILFLMVDSWRYDYLDSIITPNIYNISKKSQVFTNHYSGSNMTTGGVFSFFYGLPATYFDSFTGVEKSPVFINQLQQQNYQIGIFGSSTLENPPFNRNIFANIKNLRLNSKGNSPSERDIAITSEWLEFINNKNTTQPFFGFLFYDAAHGFDFPTQNFTPKFTPYASEVDYLSLNNEYNPEPLINRYKNSLYFIDEQIGKIIHQLEEHNLLENTIIVITSDHGQEFNDNKKGYWQHGGNFSKVQTKVPFLIFDFDKSPIIYNHQTTHYDVTPTLLRDYLGVTNDFSDFSSGENLYFKKEESWFICGYNQKYAIKNNKEIINVYQSGAFEVLDENLNPISKDADLVLITKAMQEMNKFYKKKE